MHTELQPPLWILRDSSKIHYSKIVGFAEHKNDSCVHSWLPRVDHLLYGSALRDGIMVGGCVGFGAKKRDTRRRKHLLCRGGSLL
jgi:hypothetical protein